jgi:hypothetical protein
MLCARKRGQDVDALVFAPFRCEPIGTERREGMSAKS